MQHARVFLALALLVPYVFSATAPTYRLSQTFAGNTFFDNWDFYTGNDPLQGFVNYVDQATASSKGLISSTAATAYVGVDHTSVAGSGGRDALRLQSKTVYNKGLFILDAYHMPSGCGTWPAWWFVQNQNWPDDGEIDVIENVNLATSDTTTLHTNQGCSQAKEAKSKFSGSWTSKGGHDNTDCWISDPAQSKNAGCGIHGDANSYGVPFNNHNGGVYAMEWTADHIQAFYFARNKIPANIKSGHPNPASWGKPYAYFTLGSSCPAKHFTNLQMILDLTLCGSWAGAGFEGACPGKGDCNTYVKENPSAFKEAYWGVNSIKVYVTGAAPVQKFTAASLMTALNNYRTSHGQPALAVNNAGLLKVAQSHASYIAGKGLAILEPPLASRAIVKSDYYPHAMFYEMVTEASYSDTAASIVNKFIASATNKAKLTTAGFHDLACGVVQNGAFWISCELGLLVSEKPKRGISDGSSGAPYDSFDSSEAGSGDFDNSTASSSDDDTGPCYSYFCLSDDSAWNPIKCDRNNSGCPEPACQTVTSCAAQGHQCGSVFDGCTSLSCGTCPTSQVCVPDSKTGARSCVDSGCPAGCPDNAKCVGGVCQCPHGSSIQYGECLTTPLLSMNPPTSISSYTVSGTGDWIVLVNETLPVYTQDADGNIASSDDSITVMEYEGIQQTSMTGQGVAIWTGTEKLSGNVLVFSARAQWVEGSDEFGLVFRAKSSRDYGYLGFRSGDLVLGQMQSGKKTLEKTLGSFDWPSGQWMLLEVVIRDQQYELLVDGVRYPSNQVFKMPKLATGGGVGFYANGPVNFGDIQYRTRVLTVVDAACPSTDMVTDFVNRMGWAIRANTDHITVTCNQKKRDASMNIYLEGDGDYFAESIASDLATFTESGNAALAENGLALTSVTMVDDVALAADVVTLTPAASAIAPGVIAGVVIGCVAFVAIAAVGGVVAYKKIHGSSNTTYKQEGTPQATGKKPRGAGANVFDLDPENHSSITGRSVPIKV